MSSSVEENVEKLKNCKCRSVTCEVFILIVTMVEKTLGTGKTTDALNSLSEHVWAVPGGGRCSCSLGKPSKKPGYFTVRLTVWVDSPLYGQFFMKFF